MTKKWLQWIYLGTCLIGITFLIVASLITFNRPSTFDVLEKSTQKTDLPKSQFLQPKESYDLIGTNVIKLASKPKSLQIPDLRKVLVYHGRNQRPDADIATSALHFSIAGTKTITAIFPEKKYYLIYDRRQKPARYVFSPENAETSLWFEASPEGNQTQLKVSMTNEQNELLTTPTDHAEFYLQEKPLQRQDVIPQEIGPFKIDGTLLARQKARWYGVDRFFERHGGKEFEHCIGRERLDFGEGAGTYSVFLKQGEVLAWKDGLWRNIPLGEETRGFPILSISKIDERLISFELWDSEGKTKTVLNLLKSTEPLPQKTILQGLKFVGAKTRSQFVFEFNKKRIILSPDDWLLFIDKEIKILKTPEDIDAYVDRKLSGFLFVFEFVQKRDDRQYIIGTLFNKARTEIQSIEILMQPGETAVAKSNDKVKGPGQQLPKAHTPQVATVSNNDDDDFDDDDEDDDESIKPGTPNALRARTK